MNLDLLIVQNYGHAASEHGLPYNIATNDRATEQADLFRRLLGAARRLTMEIPTVYSLIITNPVHGAGISISK